MELYNIEPKEFQILERVVIGDSIRYELEPIERPKQCPQCKDNNIAISAGVDLDELSELLKTHHTAIFQKAWETYFENINPNPDLTGFEDDVQIIGED